MDEIDLLKKFGPEPEEPEPQVLHAARHALVRRAAERGPLLTLLTGGGRYRALAPALAVAAVAAVVSGAALVGRIPGGNPAANPSASPSASAPASPTASPTGNPMPRELAALVEQAATRAEQRTIPAGKYLYSKWTDGSEVLETWQPSDRNGTWYFRSDGGAPTHRSGNAIWDGHPLTELTQGPDQFLAEFPQPNVAFNTLDDFLVGPNYGPLLTGAQRATGYRAMVKVKHVTVRESIANHAGVPGLAFTFPVGDTLQEDIIVDPETGDVIGMSGPYTPDTAGRPASGTQYNWVTITVSVVGSHP